MADKLRWYRVAARDDLPEGRVIVHVDLDYLINDFNGNPVTGYSLPNPDLTAVACSKLDSFFDAMSAIAPRVDRWIVATSPGFCSAFHWPWLLAQLEERIEALGDFGG